MYLYRWPTRLGDVHLRLVGQILRDDNIVVLEELICPRRGIGDRYVSKPWVDI